MNTCSECRYGTIARGECRRYPPQVTCGGDGDVDAWWPYVCPDEDWCGEFSPAQPADDDPLTEQREALDNEVSTPPWMLDGRRFEIGNVLQNCSNAWICTHVDAAGIPTWAPACPLCHKVTSGQLVERCDCGKRSECEGCGGGC